MISALYGDGVLEAREQQSLGNYLGDYTDLSSVDDRIDMIFGSGRLCVVDTPKVRWAMSEIKNPNLNMATFRELLANITGSLMTSSAVEAVTFGRDIKVAISIRAGMAFLSDVVAALPNAEIGMITQERDEADPRVVTSLPRKLGSFTGKHAVIVDPMLATGGSMLAVVEAVLDRGATGVTTVSAFSSPQGIVRVADHPDVLSVISTPLEAGLNEDGFIVGGFGHMLGDCGDRFFGAVDE